uniref:Uncharacterized protein n=1 Tax=viral metagenome TaxID=1070528 RepID=A0A6C0HBX3_9ZZZZ
MSQKPNKKSESVIKANSTKKTGTKKKYRNRNTYPLTNENLNVFNFANDTTSETYNTSNSSDLNDESDDDDDAETVITDYASNPYGLTTPSPAPNDEMDVDDYEPPATELKTYEGKDMYYIINGELIPVTSASYNRDMTIYDINRNIIPRGQHLPESRIINDDIMDESVKIGGKRLRKTHRKRKRNTKRNTKRKKTRRHKRRHTRKYK